METFSGYHMKICFINHCCPVQRKSNHRWGHALSEFLMHGNSEAGCVPTRWNQTCHIHTGGSARTGRSLIGKLLAAGTGGRGRGATHTPPAREHVIPGALPVQAWKAQSIALSHHLCNSHWHETNWEEMFNDLLGSLMSARILLPKGGHRFVVSTDSEISPLIYMQMMLCSGWQLMIILASKKYGLFKDYYFLPRVRIAFIF